MKRSDSSILITNVQVMYIRMLATILLGVFTTRFVFKALGEIGFGLFAVIGSSIFFVNTIESTLRSSTQRHVAFEIGKGDMEEASRVFSTSLALTSVLSLAVFWGGWLFAESIVSMLTVPTAFFAAAATALRMTTTSAAVLIFSSPFVAVVAANQNFIFQAIVSFGISAFSFGGAIALSSLPGESLENYSIIRCAIFVISSVSAVVYANHRYQVARFKLGLVSPRLLSPLLSYGGWAGLGALGWHLRLQGTQLIGNLFYGPVFNSGLGVAQQINGYAGTLPATVIKVANPMMTQLVGRDAGSKVVGLRDAVCRLCPILTMFVLGPLFIEFPQVLKLWLEEPPDLAVTFSIVVAINLVLDHLTTGYGLIFNATGNIRGYALFTFFNVCIQLAIAYCIGRFLDIPAHYLLLVVIVGTVANMMFRVTFAGEESAKTNIRHWARHALKPLFFAISLSLIAPLFIVSWLSPSIIRMLAVFAVHTCVLAICSWLIVLEAAEKNQLLTYLRRFIAKMGLL